MLIHASCVAIEGQGVLLAGPAGCGKSDLALRLIDNGAQLVADDQTQLRLENDQLIASAPASIAGLLEIRHIGLVKMPHTAKAEIVLYIDLTTTREAPERLPVTETINLLDRPVRRLRLPSFATSTPAKIRATLLYPPDPNSA